MKIVFITIFIFGYSVGHAQNQKSAIVHKISYQRGLPQAVSSATPQGAKSCFFGKFRPRQSGKQYAIHLFKADSRPEKPYKKYPGQQNFTLDIFQVSSDGIYREINRVSFNYSSSGWGYDKFGCQWFWADSRRDQVPVIKFDIWVDGERGDIGDNVFASFVSGLISIPTIQSLTFGGWRASDTLGEHNFVSRAKNGLAEVNVRLYPNEDPVDPDHTGFTLRWNGKKFWPTAPLNSVTEYYFTHSRD